MSQTTLYLIMAVVIAPGCSPSRESTRHVSETAEHQVRAGMSVSDVVMVAAGQNHQFRILGYCGSRGALNIHGDGGDAALTVWRGSPSGGVGSEVTDESSFGSVSELRAALNERLLSDGPCSKLFVGFTGGWEFHVTLGADGRVKEVEPTRAWQ
jgi:hypothetical protein